MNVLAPPVAGPDIGHHVDPDIAAALAAFEMPEVRTFGTIAAPVMFSAVYANGAWDEGRLLPYGEISILPTARSLQFAETIFEGMKAYRRGDAPPHLFRPRINAARFTASAERVGMPSVPEALFLGALRAMATSCADFVPRASGSSLYLRPFLFSTEAGFAPFNSTAFRFIVTGSPSGPYITTDMRVMIERRDIRAARGGMGYAKTGGNYAASLRSTSNAIAQGFTVSLWLDPETRTHVEELSGMNLFAVVDGELHTPPLSDTILAGVTRASIIELARHKGLQVREAPIAIDGLLADIGAGRCTELFATGTAAIVAAVVEIGDADGGRHTLPSRGVADGLRADLLAIQERSAPDPFGWTADLDQFAA